MRSYCFHTPNWLQKTLPGLIWKINTSEKTIFLTFDDGPDPEATEFVLDHLAAFSAKATFFCTGEKMQMYPDLFLKIVQNGHAIGNHTFSHLNGWRVTSEAYLDDIIKFEEVLRSFSLETTFFRPPYGKIRRKQLRRVKEKYKAVMWTCLSGDFDKNLHIKTAQTALLKGGAGSIFLFHDSFAAYNNLKQLLPVVLAYYAGAGYTFKSLSDAIN